MKSTFLVGDFLPAYAGAYKFKKRKLNGVPFPPEELSERLDNRSAKFWVKNDKYIPRLQIGFVIALSLILFAAKAPIIPEDDITFILAEQVVVEMEEIVQSKQEVKPPPPPRPPVPVSVPDDEILDDDDLDLDVTLDMDEPLAELPPPPPPVKEIEIEEEEIFIVVEQMPELIGGAAAVAAVLEYPPLAIKAGLEGMVVIEIIVGKDGNPTDPKVVRSVADILDRAAVEAVMKQSFNPGRQRNKPVRVRMAIPVRFRLKNKT